MTLCKYYRKNQVKLRLYYRRLQIRDTFYIHTFPFSAKYRIKTHFWNGMPWHIIRKVFTVALCPKNHKPNNLAAIVGGVKKKERLMITFLIPKFLHLHSVNLDNLIHQNSYFEKIWFSNPFIFSITYVRSNLKWNI